MASVWKESKLSGMRVLVRTVDMYCAKNTLVKRKIASFSEI
jgi:hypothetical protein